MELCPSAAMSEGQEGREDQAITSPETVEEHEMDDLSPIMSYNPGDDCLERVISEGESKYEGKGKGRSMPAQCQIYESSNSQAQLKVSPNSQLQCHLHPVKLQELGRTARSQVPQDPAPRQALGQTARSQAPQDPARRQALGQTARFQTPQDPVRLRPLDQ